MEFVRRTLAFPAAHVVLTGGEPMAAKEMPLDLAARLRAARQTHHHRDGRDPAAGRDFACDLASISPKLANSTPADGHHRANAWIERHERTALPA